MAKFRDSAAPDAAGTTTMTAGYSGPEVHDRSIGEIISDVRNLSVEQVEQILAYQREKNVRFGEAAIALGHASADDVLYALSQQFHYSYAVEQRDSLSRELVALNEPFSRQAEVFRAIRSQLLMRLPPESDRRAIAVVSPDSGDGKTYFAANLAISLAQVGSRTLLVDADMRGPRQHELFALDNKAGLSGILAGRAETKVVQQVPQLPGLYVLPVGVVPPNPLELVERPAFMLLMRELQSKFDHVIVDTPAASYGADPAAIAARCGAALLVARRNSARVAALQELVSLMGGASTKLAGVVINEF